MYIMGFHTTYLFVIYSFVTHVFVMHLFVTVVFVTVVFVTHVFVTHSVACVTHRLMTPSFVPLIHTPRPRSIQ